jgi:O-antigen/teichoic acid export membrane protein
MNHSVFSLPGVLKDRSAILGNFAWALGLQFVRQATALAATYFLARGLAVPTFGTYGAFMSFLAICTITTLPGMNGAIAQSVARGRSGAYRRGVILAVSGSTVGSAVCFLGWLFFRSTNADMAQALLLAVALFPVSHGMLQWHSVLSGLQNFAAVFWLGSLGAVLTAACIILGIQAFPGEILVPVISVLVIPAAINAALTARTWSQTRSHESENESGSYGIETSAYLALNIIANHLDRLLLFLLISPEIAALYIVAERLAETIKNIVQDLAAVLAPRFAQMRKYTHSADRSLWMVSTGISVAIVAMTFTILPWGLVTLFSERYAEAIPIAQGLMISVAIGNHAMLRSRYIKSRLDAPGFRDITLYPSGVRLIATVCLVPLLGLWGAVASAVIYRLATVAVVSLKIRQRHLQP